MFGKKLIGAMVLSSLGATAVAHNGATGLVMERMMGMSAMRDVMRDLAPIMQGQVVYDVSVVQQGAAKITEHAGDNMNELFPQEAIPAASYAKPAIWDEWARFTSLSEDLQMYAAGLATAAPNGLAPPTPIQADESAEAPMADHSQMQMAAAPVKFSIAELMGAAQPVAATGGMMMASSASGIDFSRMAASDVFEKVTQTCSACHSQFRNGN